MQALLNFGYFMLALGILVTFHEWGHFWVARKLGIKVLTFSFGFGPVLWSRIGKDGVCYQLAAVPLGGYVKMLDSREDDVEAKEQHLAFDKQNVWKRIAVVLAGPFANFVLAILFYWFVFGIGIGGLNTKIGEVIEDSVAANAGIKSGDLILSVDDLKTNTTSELIRSLALRLGEKGTIFIEVEREGFTKPLLLKAALNGWHLDPRKDNLLHSFGLKHERETRPALIDSVAKAAAADQAGIKVGDQIIGFNEQNVDNWNQLVRLISAHPGQKVTLRILRNGELREKAVVIGERLVGKAKQGYLGVAVNNRNAWVITKASGFWNGLEMGVTETWKMLRLSAGLFGKLIKGELSLSSLSGPIAIAEGAGGSAGIGLVYFVSFIAMISVNLGFINLLPIPMLDGGHLLYFIVESVKGKPLSEKIQLVGLKLGMMLVFAMMAIAIFNDLSNL